MSSKKPFKVLWTETAERTIQEVLDYLILKWTQKEVDSFLNEVDRIINAIEIYPKLFTPSKKRDNIHLALITKHTFLIYQVRPAKNQIILLIFWDTRQNPKKLKY